MMKGNDINDYEIRFIGTDTPSGAPPEIPKHLETRRKRKPWIWIIIAVIVILLGIIILLIISKKNNSASISYVQKPESQSVVLNQMESGKTVLNDSLVNQGEAKRTPHLCFYEDSINDIPFTIITPEDCTPHLYIGKVDTTNLRILLCARAADIREDNNGIVSAFVLKGEPISRGISMKGFCAIISDTLSIGMDEETPLYERVVEHGGDFFRQYPLVHNCQMVESKLKNKAVRKALCIIGGQVSVFVSKGRESMHDFAQALQDYGVQEAIALEGGDSHFFARHDDGSIQWFGRYYPKGDLNYIIFE